MILGYTDLDESQYASEVVCVAPNTVVRGSRQPNLQFPHSQNDSGSQNSPSKANGENGTRWRSGWKLAVIGFFVGATGPMYVYS